MKRLSVICLLLVLIAGYGYAQDIVASTIESWPPFMFKQDGEITGIATDVVRATFKKAGVSLKIQIYPWARAYKTALDKKNTMVFMLYRTPDREELFKWIGPR